MYTIISICLLKRLSSIRIVIQSCDRNMEMKRHFWRNDVDHTIISESISVKGIRNSNCNLKLGTFCHEGLFGNVTLALRANPI